MESEIVYYYNFGRKYIDSRQLGEWYKDIKKLLTTKEGKEILGIFVTTLELYEEQKTENIECDKNIAKKAKNLLEKYGFSTQITNCRSSSCDFEK